MRTSATGISNNRPRERGFTLIEVLVVVTIVAIISAVVLLSSNLVADDREVRQEVRRMASLVELAADEALLQGREFGLEFRRQGYRFVEYDPVSDRWYEVAGDELLRPRSLPEPLHFELFIEDRRVQLPVEHARIGGAQSRTTSRDAEYAPHTLIMSSGQLSPFSVEVVEGNERSGLAMEVTPAGEIDIDDGSDDDV